MTKDAFGALVDALARRDLTSTELEERLARSGFDAEACADAIARAAAAGYLDDERVAMERALRLGERDASDTAIRAELLRRGLGKALIEAALEALPPERERAERLALRLGGGPRAARALARKGYAEEVVERAVGLDIAQ